MLSPEARDHLQAQRNVGSLGVPSFLGQKTANPFNFRQEHPIVAPPQQLTPTALSTYMPNCSEIFELE